MSTAVKLASKNPILSKEVVSAVMDSVKTTISTITSLKVTALPAYIEPKLELETEIAGVVGITSNQDRGILLISFSKEAIIQIHNNMLGESVTELTDSVVDVVGELSNMVYGSSKSTLNKKGYNFQMAIPTIAKGKFQLSNKANVMTVFMPFQIDEKHNFLVALSVE